MTVRLFLFGLYAGGADSDRELIKPHTAVFTSEAALKNIPAVTISGGSSGIGKSFIELTRKLRPENSFCNLSRRAPAMDMLKLKPRHVAGIFSARQK
jgi:hypothetical protein